MFRRLIFSVAILFPGIVFADRACDTKFGKICVETVQTDTSVVFYAENRYQLLPVTLNVDLELNNLSRSAGGAGPFVLNGGDRLRLFTLSQQQNAQWSYRYTFTWSRGDITAHHDDRQVPTRQARSATKS